MTLGAGGAAPTSGEDSDGEGSDEAADALPASATDIGSAVADVGLLEYIGVYCDIL